jgi:hypothetical protein
MADDNQEQQEQTEQQEQSGLSSPATGTAVKAVAAAAATGAAALAAKKVISGRGSNGNPTNGGSPERQSGEPTILNSVLAGSWEAAREALIPAAEDAAGAAGEYVAQHGPDVLRDRIVPRFVDSFNEARGGS